MLDILGRSTPRCDGLGRRDFLRIGGFAMGGLSLHSLLAAEARAKAAATGKSLINIYLSGGPTHLDTFDLKPQAPVEIRGEFSPIGTSVPGLEICELMPRLAGLADKYSVIRSMTGMHDEHQGKQNESGWDTRSLRSLGGRPGIGAVMSKVWGGTTAGPDGNAPTHVDLTGWTKPGFLGASHSAFRPSGEDRANLVLQGGVTLERLRDRQRLLGGLDRLRRDVDASGTGEAMDAFRQRAVDIVASGRLAEALDVQREAPEVIADYGIDRRKDLDRFLLARRLVEAGVRCVSLTWGFWDTHGDQFRNNAENMRLQLPHLDTAVGALLADLDRSGLLDSTIVMMAGEFGRTPRINEKGGRDHWARAGFCLLAGGGLQPGQVVGATNSRGEEPIERPVHLQHVFTTLYHQLGIDPGTTQLTDPNGRPQYLLDNRELIPEVL